MEKQFIFIVCILLVDVFFAQTKLEDKSVLDSSQKSIVIRIDSSSIERKLFDTSKIETYKNSDEFNYSVPEVKLSFFNKVWNWIKKVFRNILHYFFDDIKPITGFLYSFFRILPYIILVIALFFSLKYFLDIRTNNILQVNNKNLFTSGTDEELLKRDDLNGLLKKAIDSEEYRIAVRFYYLLILKKLTELALIDWQQEKTNEDYIKELKESSIQSRFSDSTRIYDFVWYGNFTINQTDFTKAELLFKSILNS